MFTTHIAINQLLTGYCTTLLGDIPDDRMAEQPVPLVNHPAWILGHLAFAGDRAVRALGGETLLDETWATRFGPGSKLTANRADYPAQTELASAVERVYERARTLAVSPSPERMAQPNPNPRLNGMLPTLEHAVAFLLTGHMALHLGQFSTWRRMIGLPPLF